MSSGKTTSPVFPLSLAANADGCDGEVSCLMFDCVLNLTRTFSPAQGWKVDGTLGMVAAILFEGE
eukprot:791519-Rhodomonas_salina.2